MIRKGMKKKDKVSKFEWVEVHINKNAEVRELVWWERW